jgi:hypothetical protein
MTAPAIFQTTFEITGEPGDTFIEVNDWLNGIIFVSSGFNLGRYYPTVEPQRTLYVNFRAVMIIYIYICSKTYVYFDKYANTGEM